MSKLERLLNLTAVLLETERPLSAEDLRRSVEGYPPPGPSFRRTFERDKDDLRTMGIPLRVERVPGTDPPLDGYRIPPDEYYLADPGLDAEELAALHLATLAVRLEGSSEGREALWKLGGLSVEVEAVTDASVASVPLDDAVTPLFDAIRNRQPVRFTYRDLERLVDPWRLHFQRGRWYVSGHDRGRDAERNYRLDRIQGTVEVVADQHWAVEPRAHEPGRSLHGWELGEDDPIQVELQVDEQRVPWMRRMLGPTVTESDPDRAGAVVFTVPVVNRAAFRSMALGLLDHAVVLSPPEVRQDLIDWLEAVSARGDVA